ncbi:MAG: tyrosine-type recombinase/integrase, partial [Polaromonas sp.]
AAAEALNAWLESSGIVEGRIFRRIPKSGHIGASLAAGAVRDIVKLRCALAGMTGQFSAHSLRSGFVTEAGRQNMSLAETMAMTGHNSVATVMGYSRAGSSLTNQIAHLFDNH